jgi:hypothetical protein
MKSPKERRTYRPQADEFAELASFRWSRGTYEWVEATQLQSTSSRVDDGANENAVYLVQRPAEGNSEYVPDPALFREFADVPSTREDILSFANKYGWLGPSELVVRRGVESTVYTMPKDVAEAMKSSGAPRQRGRKLSRTRNLYPVQLGERPDKWFKEIAAMNRLLKILDPPRGSDSTKRRFQQRIRWTANQVIYEWRTDEGEVIDVIASEEERPQQFALLQKANLREILRYYLARSINERLAAHRVKVQLFPDSPSERVGLRIVPETLIGFLWLQFAKAVEGGRSYRRCEDCSKWFEFGGQSSRSDKRFCSDTCRVRNGRKR